MSFRVHNDHRHHVHQSERLHTQNLTFGSPNSSIQYQYRNVVDNQVLSGSPLILTPFNPPTRNIELRFTSGILVPAQTFEIQIDPGVNLKNAQVIPSLVYQTLPSGIALGNFHLDQNNEAFRYIFENLSLANFDASLNNISFFFTIIN